MENGTMAIKVGDKLPQATFRVMTAEGPAAKTTEELFKGRKVVLFAVPGAFTPTCHKNHLPGFLAKAEVAPVFGCGEGRHRHCRQQGQRAPTRMARRFRGAQAAARTPQPRGEIARPKLLQTDWGQVHAAFPNG